MTNAATGHTAGPGPEDAASSPRGQARNPMVMSPRTVVTAVQFAVLVATTVLLWVGAIAWAWFWFVMWAAAMANLFGALRLNDRMLAAQARFLDMISAANSVRCAGCHARTVLPGPIIEDDGTMYSRLPEGWAMSHARPYCPTCAAKGN